MSMNKVFLVGRLTADVELLDRGPSPKAMFTIAINERWKDKSGKQIDRVEFVKVAAWGKLALVCADFLRKGKQCFVEGSLHTREYETNEGLKKQITEVKANTVQFLDGARNEAG